MGFLGSIGSFLGTAAKAVATGGLSVVAPKLIPKPINTALNAVTALQFPTSLKSAAGIGLAVATKNPSFLPFGASPTQFQASGGQPMALNLGGILSGVSSIFGGNQNPYFQGISNVTSLASQFVPQPVINPPVARNPMMNAPMRAIGTVGRGFFNKFPNLATAIQAFRNQGRNVKRSQLYAMLKRFGPDILISGGILTAAAVSELMVAGPGRRRMNPGNVHALRRSMRRLESFHRLCVQSDKLRRTRVRSKGCKSGSRTFVRQG